MQGNNSEVSAASVERTSSSTKSNSVVYDVQYYIDQGYSRVRAIKLFYENSNNKELASAASTESSAAEIDGRLKVRFVILSFYSESILKKSLVCLSPNYIIIFCFFVIVICPFGAGKGTHQVAAGTVFVH